MTFQIDRVLAKDGKGKIEFKAANNQALDQEHVRGCGGRSFFSTRPALDVPVLAFCVALSK